MKHYFRTWLFLAWTTSVPVASVVAQSRATTADLSGTVLDQSSAVLPGAIVMTRNDDTNLERSSVSDERGRFLIPALPPGRYTVRAELAGFNARTLNDLEIAVGSQIDLTLTLGVAGGQELVTVAGESPVVDLQKTAVSNVVTQDQIEALPINGRNFIGFSLITPGVTTDRTPQQGASGTSGLTFAGQRARSNNITVDGLDNNDAAVGSVRATFSQEAVREFQVLTSSYSAEFGKASGGVVNIVTKSGTNTRAGNAFLFLRDESLNAKERFEKFDPAGNALSRDKAPYGQKQFGGTYGGPLVTDRTFYFVSFERLDVDANNFVNINDQSVVTFGGAPLGTPAQILRDAGFPIQTGNIPYRVESTTFLAKGDHRFDANNAVDVRFNWASDLNENIEPFGGIVARSRGAELDSNDAMLAGSHTWIRSSRMVNELRVQLASRDQTVRSLDASCDGPCVGEDEGGPTLEVLGVASIGRQRFTPQPRKNTRVQVLDTLSYHVGNHQLKGGIDVNFIDASEQRLPLHFGGRYIFSTIPAEAAPQFGLPSVAIPSIVAVQLGLPGRYVQGYGNSAAPYKYRDFSMFVQDDWRLSSRLTLKGGLRYQVQGWPDVTYGVSGYPQTYRFPGDGNNLAPRLAVAWDPTGGRTMSVRAAYGVYFDNVITGILGITKGINGTDGVRTLVASLPLSSAAWRAPQRRLPEAAAGAYPSLVISVDPGLKTPFAHHISGGVTREFLGSMSVSADVVFVRGFNHPGTIDYNPIVPSLGPNRRPADVDGVARTSASVLQYTSFGETWYRGLMVSVSRRFSDRYQYLASYTLSKAEDTSADFQSEFIPQDSGRGRNPQDLEGLPLGFDPDTERGPSLQDQRHRLVLSGTYLLPYEIALSSIITVASGRPYNILAGADLNGDGDGGATDRPRRIPGDITSSVGRNSGTLPGHATVDMRLSRRFPVGSFTVDGIFEVFNLFNRTNYTAVNNVFGPGVFPSGGVPTFGQYTQAAAARQMQLAVKLGF